MIGMIPQDIINRRPSSLGWVVLYKFLKENAVPMLKLIHLFVCILRVNVMMCFVSVSNHPVVNRLKSTPPHTFCILGRSSNHLERLRGKRSRLSGRPVEQARQEASWSATDSGLFGWLATVQSRVVIAAHALQYVARHCRSGLDIDNGWELEVVSSIVVRLLRRLGLLGRLFSWLEDNHHFASLGGAADVRVL